MKPKIAIISVVSSCSMLHAAFAFEGRIAATLTRGGDAAQNILYTVNTNFLRVENTAANWSNPVNLVDCRKHRSINLALPSQP